MMRPDSYTGSAVSGCLSLAAGDLILLCSTNYIDIELK